jgi:alanine-synthesizing transaminase
VSFSSRTPGQLAPNRLATAVAARRAAGLPLLDLTCSNPTEVGLDYPTAELAAALAAGAAAPYRPDPRGLESARVELAGRLGAAPERIFLTASTSEAYGYLIKLLCDPGDELLVPIPSYPLFEHLARLDAAHARPYRLGPAPRFALDADRVEVELGERTRAVVVVTPNNPTGQVASAAELAELAELCAGRGLALISDEVFADYASAPSALAAEGPLRFSLGGLSKSCGLPHFKLGWLAMAGPPEACEAAALRLEHIADSYLSPSTPVMAALPLLLDIGSGIRAAIAARIADNRRRAAELLGPRLLDASGAWTAVITLDPDTDEEDLAVGLVERRGVLVHPGYFFDFDRGAHAVVSLLVPPDHLSAGLTALLEKSD